MDLDSIPLGTDFRKHIRGVWSEIKVLIVVIGPNWLGPAESKRTRIHEKTDVVRVEVEMALKQGIFVIPVLVDNAVMPSVSQLPRSLHMLADRNAAKIDSGRDFHFHVDQLIQAIDEVVGKESVPRRLENETPDTELVKRHAAWIEGSVPDSERNRTLIKFGLLFEEIALPVAALIMLHHLIVNVFDFSTTYLRIVSFVVPILFGIRSFWRARREPMAAFAVAAAVGLIAVAVMIVLAGLNSGRPIMPSTTFEWRESIEYVVSITFGFFVGYILARSLKTAQWNKVDKS